MMTPYSANQMTMPLSFYKHKKLFYSKQKVLFCVETYVHDIWSVKLYVPKQSSQTNTQAKIQHALKSLCMCL